MSADGSCGGPLQADPTETEELVGAILIPAEVDKYHAIRDAAPARLAFCFRVGVQMAEWRMRVSSDYLLRERAGAKRQSRLMRRT